MVKVMAKVAAKAIRKARPTMRKMARPTTKPINTVAPKATGMPVFLMYHQMVTQKNWLLV